MRTYKDTVIIILIILLSACGSSGKSNTLLTAVARADKYTVFEGESVNLDGSNSSEGDLSYQWTYTYGGEKYSLTGIKPTFITPEISQQSYPLEILLTVSDNNSRISTDKLVITVDNIQINEYTLSLVKKCRGDFLNELDPISLNGSYVSQQTLFDCRIDYPVTLQQLEVNELEKFKNLEQLEITNFDFSTANRGTIAISSFPNLSSLEKLKSITLNHIDFLNADNFSLLSKLESLDLESSSLNFELNELSNLKNIKLRNVKATNTIEIKQMNNLERLWIENTPIKEISNTFSNLTELYIYKVIIEDSIDLTNATNLERLYITDSGPVGSDKQVDLLGIPNLLKLNTLTIQNNTDNFLGNKIDISNLHELQELFISGNRLANTSSFSNLSKLKSLQLQRNNLHQLNGLEGLVNLELLHLIGNGLKSINGISSLNKLKILTLRGNDLGQLNNLEGLINLEVLRLHENGLTSIPDLKLLNKLKYLSFSNASINHYPDVSMLPILNTVHFTYDRKAMDINNLIKTPQSSHLLIQLELICKDDNLDIQNLNSYSWIRAYVDELNFNYFSSQGVCNN